MTTMIKSFNKNSAKNFLSSFLFPSLKNSFMFFFSKFIMAGPDFGSPNHWFAGYAIN
jgi:hypothetical protein